LLKQHKRETDLLRGERIDLDERNICVLEDQDKSEKPNIRNYLTNKLINEGIDPTAAIRMFGF
jgi:hypothetical protein